ncbi:hypothetical protein ABZ299_27755 [Streptomyces sp. NPDC006184]|uniref:hypothetical protein n=1 Tax=Streptomyces sp. NPDC006184 TaxID=3155455 RepID=UPI0033B20B0F
MVSVYEDHPGDALRINSPIPHPVPHLGTQPFPTTIAEAAPQPNGAGPGTEAFRYWVAADALSRAGQTWASSVPAGTQWHSTVGGALTANLAAGNDLNAFYDRRGLWFFRRTVAGLTVAACESPEVVEHEPGHAILDVLRPRLFNTATAETAALHEAFGDITATSKTFSAAAASTYPRSTAPIRRSSTTPPPGSTRTRSCGAATGEGLALIRRCFD